MKYLKTFEIQTEEDREIASIEGQKNSDYIQSLIDEYLAYIKDDGFKIIETPKHGYRYRLTWLMIMLVVYYT